MANLPLTLAYKHFLDYLVEKATPQEILAYQIPDAERERALDLLDKQNEGTLSTDEEAELEAMRKMDLLLMGLRAKARRALRGAND